MSGSATILVIYIILNIIVALVYALDKHKAVEGKWRIPERTLIILGFLGPFGAVSGMKIFHHKTQKPKFKLNYLFLVIHILIIVLIVAETM